MAVADVLVFATMLVSLGLLLPVPLVCSVYATEVERINLGVGMIDMLGLHKERKGYNMLIWEALVLMFLLYVFTSILITREENREARRQSENVGVHHGLRAHEPGEDPVVGRINAKIRRAAHERYFILETAAAFRQLRRRLITNQIHSTEDMLWWYQQHSDKTAKHAEVG